MTHHAHDTSTDEAAEGAQPRPQELKDRLEGIVESPAPPPEDPEKVPLSTSPNNPYEARPGAVAPQEFQKDPGRTDAGGGG